MRVCDYIANRLVELGIKNIYGLMGGGAAGLNDGFIKNADINYICFHHEQGAAHAAIGEAKYTNNFSVVNPTTGCGGTNCITSVLNAWQDSVPLLVISGNVSQSHSSHQFYNVRKYGIQEHFIVKDVANITKFAAYIETAQEVPYMLDYAIYCALSDRKGPVWIDIPSDIQTAEINLDMCDKFVPIVSQKIQIVNNEIFDLILTKLNSAIRPVILAGQGIKQSNCINLFKEFIEKYNVPYVSTFGARDLLPYNHHLNIGAIGIKGSRTGNFVMQSADLLLILGCSVNIPHTGYSVKDWSPNSFKIIVDIDSDEINKNTVAYNIALNYDLNNFLQKMVSL